MKLPEQLPTDPEELEALYRAYSPDSDDFDEAEFQRLMDARLAVWGSDPHQMTADQIFGAMTESMNSMLLNLYSAKGEAPDEESSAQVDEIIHIAEQLREQIQLARQGAEDTPPDHAAS
jgi:hypothetical protein